MQNAEIFWDKVVEKYARSPISDMDAYNHTLERTRSYLSQQDHVLEVGCGTASTGLLLADNVKKITVSDLSGKMLEAGRKKAQQQQITNINFFKADLMLDQFRDAPYDTVLAFNIFHLLQDQPAAYEKVAKLVKPGGLFISKTFCGGEPSNQLKVTLMKAIIPVMQLLKKAPYVNFMTINELENNIKSAGFKILESGNYPASPPSRYIVAQKL